MEEEIWRLASRIKNYSEKLVYLLDQQRRQIPPLERTQEDIEILSVHPHYHAAGMKALELTLAWPKMRFKPGDIIRVSVVKRED